MDNLVSLHTEFPDLDSAELAILQIKGCVNVKRAVINLKTEHSTQESCPMQNAVIPVLSTTSTAPAALDVSGDYAFVHKRKTIAVDILCNEYDKSIVNNILSSYAFKS